MVTRLTPRRETIRALFALSGNQCAFPGCTQRLINDRNQFTGQICHIEAALPGGQRYNINQSDEERRAYDNLLLLCYQHHVETNDGNEFPVDTLRRFKRDHEALFRGFDFQIDEVALCMIIAEMDQYWAEIERLNTTEHTMVDLAFPIDVRSSFLDILRGFEDSIKRLSGNHDTVRLSDDALQQDFEALLQTRGVDPQIFDNVPYFENPFHSRNWELHNLGIPNLMMRIRIDLIHLEVKYLEEFLKTNGKDAVAQERLRDLKVKLADLAQNAITAD